MFLVWFCVCISRVSVESDLILFCRCYLFFGSGLLQVGAYRKFGSAISSVCWSLAGIGPFCLACLFEAFFFFFFFFIFSLKSSSHCFNPLRKRTYSNILKISPPKPEKFLNKNSGIFHISAQNIDCGYSSTSTHNLCFWAAIRRIIYTPVNPSFTI